MRLHLEAFFIATKEKSKDYWKADRNNVTCIQCFFVTIFQLAIPAFLGLQMLLNLWQELQCYTILGRKSTPFVYVQLKNGTPSTHLVYNFACIPFHCCKCTVLFNNMNKSRSLWEKKPRTFSRLFSVCLFGSLNFIRLLRVVITPSVTCWEEKTTRSNRMNFRLPFWSFLTTGNDRFPSPRYTWYPGTHALF